jgi:hypothetical protein
VTHNIINHHTRNDNHNARNDYHYTHLTLLRVAPTACPRKAGFNESYSVTIAGRAINGFLNDGLWCSTNAFIKTSMQHARRAIFPAAI